MSDRSHSHDPNNRHQSKPPQDTEETTILYQLCFTVNCPLYERPIFLNMRLFKVTFSEKELWMPFNEPHPFQILRFCWKFPDAEPQTEFHELSGLDGNELIQRANSLSIAKAQSLSHSCSGSHRRRRRRRSE